MGFFDRFKKQKGSLPESGNGNNPAANHVWDIANLYREYISIFIQFLSKGNYAPIAAYQKKNGDLVGTLFMSEENGAYVIQADRAVLELTERLSKMLELQEIQSFVVLYHTDQVDGTGPFPVADDELEMKAIAMVFQHHTYGMGSILLPWAVNDGYLNFSIIEGLSDAQFNSLLQTQLASEKDYFTDRLTSSPPSLVNDRGVKILQHNTLETGNIWGGLLGFERTKRPEWGVEYQLLMQKGIAFPLIQMVNGIVVTEQAYGEMRVMAWTVGNECIEIVPRIPSNTILSVVPREVNEWENFGGNLAIVAGRAKDTFGVWFFATDFCLHKLAYSSPEPIQIRLSGLVYVLHPNGEMNSEGEIRYAPNFAGYFPNQQLPNYGCFDFVGGVLAVKAVSVPELGMDGYFLTIRLINKEDDPEFFNLDAFVAKENMRLEVIEVGMQVTGMVQFIGERVN